MRESFDIAIEFVLKREGGYINDPRDPGGETKFGISKRSYPQLDIKNLTKEQAIAIYRKDYWQRCGCDSMSYPMDVIVFDTAVNMGVQRALTLYQENTDWRDYLLARIQHYNSIARKNPAFLRGWINRVIELWKTVKG